MRLTSAGARAQASARAANRTSGYCCCSKALHERLVGLAQALLRSPPPGASRAQSAARAMSRRLCCSSPGRRSASSGSKRRRGRSRRPGARTARRRLQLAPDRDHVGLDARRDVVGAGLARRGAQRADDVADVDVVARGLAVAVELRRLAGVQVVGEDRHDAGLAVRALARAVDVAQAADGVRECPRTATTCSRRPRRPLGCAVGRERRRGCGPRGSASARRRRTARRRSR